MKLLRISRPARIILLLAIAIPLLAVGALLLTAVLQRGEATPAQPTQVDLAAFNQAIAEGDAHLASGAFVQAIASYDQAAQFNALSPIPAVKRGNVYLAQGQYSEALGQFEAAIRQDNAYALAYFQIGEIYRLQGDESGALDQYRRVLRISSTFADAYIQIGGIYQNRGDLARAAENYNEGLKAAVGDSRAQASALTRLGNLDMLQGDAEQAKARYQQAQAADPNFAGSYVQLGQIYATEGLQNEALAQFQQAIQANPNNANAQVLLGQTYSRLGQLDEAETHFQEAIRLTSLAPYSEFADVRAYFWLGQIYETRARMDGAIELYEQGMALAPEAVSPAAAGPSAGGALSKRDFQMALANVYRAQANYEQAIATYQALLEAFPSDIDIYVELGATYQTMGDEASARQAYSHVAEQVADQPRQVALALTRLGNTFRNAGNLEAAQTRYEEALAADPTYVGAYLQMAFLYEQQERYEDALAAYQQAVQYGPNEAEAHLKLGQAYRRAGRLDEASEELTQALALDPVLRRAILELGLAFEAQGRLDEAIERYADAVDINNIDPEGLFLLGQAYRQAGRPAEAVKPLGRLWELRPSHPGAAAQLGQAYITLGRYDDAIEVLEAALAVDPSAIIAFHLGEAYRLQGDLAQAEARYSQALAADPGFTSAKLQLATIYQAQGKAEAAAAAVEQVLQAGLDDPTITAAALTKLGNVLAEQGQTDEAIERYRAALAADPAYGGAYLQLGALYENLDDLAAALAAYADGVGALPNNAELQLKLGQAHRKEGRPAEAIAEIERSLAIVQQAPDAAFNHWLAHKELGMLYEDSYQMVQAISHFSTTVQLAPADPDSLFRLAQAYRKGDQAQAAIATFGELLALPASAICPPQGICWQIGAYIQLGQSHELLGDYGEAERYYRLAIDAAEEAQPQPDDEEPSKLAAAYFLLGELYRKQGQTEAAIANFEQALDLDPDLIDAKVQLGLTYQEADDIDQALTLINSVVDDPNSPANAVAQAYTKLGNLALAQSDTPDAIAKYQAAQFADPTYIGSYLQLAQLYESQGRVQDGLAQYEAAAAANETSSEAYIRLGQAYRRAGRAGDAVAALEQAVEITPGNVEAYLQLSLALIDDEDEDRAEILLNKALRLSQQAALASRTLTQRGDLRRSQGRYSAAIVDYNEAINLDEGNLPAYVGLGETYRLRGGLDEAIQQYEAALEQDPTYTDAHIKLGHALRDVGQMDAAVAAYEQAVELLPDNAWYRIVLGDGYVTAGQPDEAVAAYEAGAERQPSYLQQVWYYLRLVDAYLAQGEVDAALAAAEQAQSLDETGEGPLLLQADIMLSQKRWREAINLYEAVLEVNPLRAQAMRGLALALESAGQKQQAILQWQAYLKQAPNGEYASEARNHLRQLRGTSE